MKREYTAPVSSAPLPKGLVTLLQSERILFLLPKSGNVWSYRRYSPTDPTKLQKNLNFPEASLELCSHSPLPLLWCCLAALLGCFDSFQSGSLHHFVLTRQAITAMFHCTALWFSINHILFAAPCLTRQGVATVIRVPHAG